MNNNPNALRKYVALPPIEPGKSPMDRLKSRVAQLGQRVRGSLSPLDSKHSVISVDTPDLNQVDMSELEYPTAPTVEVNYMTMAATTHPVDEFKQVFGSTHMFQFASVHIAPPEKTKVRVNAVILFIVA